MGERTREKMRRGAPAPFAQFNATIILEGAVLWHGSSSLSLLLIRKMELIFMAQAC